MKTLNEAAANAEPVAYRKKGSDGMWHLFHHAIGWKDCSGFEPLFTHPSPSPVPTTRPLTLKEEEMMQSLGVTGKCVRVLALNDRPAQAGEPVARVAGVDEYGPRIDWFVHWAKLCGANLYVNSPAPDLFWNDDDAEQCHHSIGELLSDEICNGSLEVGELRTIQRAVSLPKITIRIVSIDDDACDAEYEIVEPPQGDKP